MNRTGAALAFLQFEHEPVALADFAGDVLADRLVEVGEYVQLHQLRQQQVRFCADAQRQVAHDDGRFHLDDFVALVVDEVRWRRRQSSRCSRCARGRGNNRARRRRRGFRRRLLR